MVSYVQISKTIKKVIIYRSHPIHAPGYSLPCLESKSPTAPSFLSCSFLGVGQVSLGSTRLSVGRCCIGSHRLQLITGYNLLLNELPY